MLRQMGNRGSVLSKRLKTVFNPQDLMDLREKSAEVVLPLTQ